MIKLKTTLLLCLATAGMTQAAIARAQSVREPAPVPQAYGTQDYTVTYVPAVAFYPEASSHGYHTSGSHGRYGDPNVEMDFYAAVDIPQGAVIDYIGLNNLNDSTPGVMTLRLADRDSSGNVIVDATVANTPHASWSTDMSAGPIGFHWHYPDPMYLSVHVLSSPNLQFIGGAEVWWRRTVSSAPGTATFNDVAVGSTYFQFVEALVSSGITAGCGGGNYCPDNPVTRAQMAVFLSKALGLHWGIPAP